MRDNVSMDAQAFVLQQMNDALTQVTACFAGAPASYYDVKITSQAFTPAETLAHFSECYLAFEKSLTGEEHAWGTYEPADTAPEALMADFQRRHAAAVQVLSGSPSDEVLKHASAYLTAHDFYHVGQLVLARLEVEPEWSHYSIYGM